MIRYPFFGDLSVHQPCDSSTLCGPDGGDQALGTAAEYSGAAVGTVAGRLQAGGKAVGGQRWAGRCDSSRGRADVHASCHSPQKWWGHGAG